MNLSENFIRRPVMTLLVMATIAFFGILSFFTLPVSDLPQVEFPTIQVTVDYPGADPETIANNVIVPLEQQFTTIEGIQTISSKSMTGNATIVLQFILDKSIDLAAPDVQAAINAATPHLPKDLPYAPVYTKVNPTSSPILFFAVSSQTLTGGELYDYAHTVIGERLSIVEGVAQVETYGAPYAVRIQVDPQKLAARDIGIDEFAETIKEANVYLPTGTLFGEKTEFTISCRGQINEAEGYESLIIKNNGGSITRVRDVGQAFDSTQNDKYFLRYFTKDTEELMVGLAVQKQPGANTLSIIKDINDILPQIISEMPGSLKVWRVYDQSEYIEESVRDVELTLLIALALVVAVIFVYLGKAINTIIPALAIPITILGTFAIMHILGYTVDILSLLAITLAIGFLVDDAVVVLENIVRHIEHGSVPMEGALNGSKQISFTILSMTLCLASVFIPLMFMQGIIGRILHEFAFTIVTAILISGAISLSFTPMLCSRLVPSYSQETKKTRMEKFSDKFNHGLIKYYEPSLTWCLNHKKTILGVSLIGLAATIFLLIILPKDFLPEDDIGFIEGYSQALDGTSPFKTAKELEKLCDIARKNPYVEQVVAIGDVTQDNQGVYYIRLKPLNERPSTPVVLKMLYKEFENIIGVQTFLKPLPLINLQVGASDSKGNYQYTLQSLNPTDLYQYASLMQEKIKTLKGFAQVTSDLDISQPELQIQILRDQASVYGVTALQIENTLSLAFGDINLSPINAPDNQYYVIMEVLPKFYQDPTKLSQLWLRSTNGGLVPLSGVVKMEEGIGPLTMNRINGLPSATITFNLVDIPLGTALTEINKIAKQTLPPTVFGTVQGAADIFKQSFANLNFLLLITIFIIYVILGILYENFFHPLTVMSTLPPAALGALISLLIFGDSLSLYAFVGIILLLGIVMKNGIIMVDFANEAVEKEKKSAHDAIYQACLVRFRPILMTTFAALMGAVPIAIGVGGLTAQGRRPLGLVIVGGLIFSQILTLYLTPVTYVYLETFREWLKKKKTKA